MRFAKSICKRISLSRQLINNRTTRIPQSHYFRAFINCFTRSIINSLSQNLHIVVRIHTDNLRISTGNQ